MQGMYYIDLDVHKRTISYCVKDVSGRIHREGSIPATRIDLDRWMNTLPHPWMAAMEATVFTGWTLFMESMQNPPVFLRGLKRLLKRLAPLRLARKIR